MWIQSHGHPFFRKLPQATSSIASCQAAPRPQPFQESQVTGVCWLWHAGDRRGRAGGREGDGEWEGCEQRGGGGATQLCVRSEIGPTAVRSGTYVRERWPLHQQGAQGHWVCTEHFA